MEPLILSLDLSVSNMNKIDRDNFFAPIWHILPKYTKYPGCVVFYKGLT